MPRPADGVHAGHPDRGRILWVLSLSVVLVVSANSGLNVALPALVDALGASQTQLQWIVGAYALVFAGLVLPGGALGDRLGRKGTLQVGLTIFGVASLAAPLAGGPVAVIVARGVMGVGAALVLPATLSILAGVFPPHERGRAIGTWAGFAGAGAALGPVVSGLLLQRFGWGWVFLANLPIIGVALAAGAWLIPVSRASGRQPFDLVGGALSVLGLGGLVFGIIEGPERGWLGPVTLAGAGAGALFLVLFVAWERRAAAPMLDLSWFADRRFSVGAATITLAFLAGIGFAFLLPQYLQFVLGYSPLAAGFAGLPFAAALFLLARRSGGLADRLGPRVTVVVGLVVLAGGFGYLALVAVSHTGYFWLVPGLAAAGAGIALSTAPSTALILAALPPDRAGVGSAVNDVTRELGASLGVALLGSILASLYRGALAAAPLPDRVAEVARESIGAALHIARQTSDPHLAEILGTAATAAFVHGYQAALLTAAAVAAFAALAVHRLGPGRALPTRRVPPR